MTVAENKVKFGLSKVAYALYDETAGTYSTPVMIPGAVNLSLDAQGDSSKFRADNTDYYVAYSNNGYNGDLEVAKFPEQMKVDVWGNTLATTDNVLVESGLPVNNKFALLFQFEGDQYETLHVLYNCTASRPAVSSATTDTTITPQTEKSTITAIKNAKGVSKASTTKDTPKSVKDAWFTTVYETASV